MLKLWQKFDLDEEMMGKLATKNCTSLTFRMQAGNSGKNCLPEAMTCLNRTRVSAAFLRASF